MATHGNLTQTLHTALFSPTPSQRHAALQTLQTNSTPLPPTFPAQLLLTLSTLPDRPCTKLALILLAHATPPSHLPLSKKLPILTAATLKSPPSPNTLLTLVRAAAHLAALSPLLHIPALSLLFAALSALEAIPCPPSGPARRRKVASLAAAYTSAVVLLRPVAPVLKASLLDATAKHNSPHVTLAALGLLAQLVPLSGAELRQVVICAASLCVRAGEDVTDRVVQLCISVLEQAEEEHVTEDVLPVLERALLREPERAFPGCIAFLAATSRMDASAAAEKRLFPAVVQAVKSSVERTRKCGVALSRVLGGVVRDADVVCQGVRRIVRFLGEARYTYQKIAAIDAIEAMTCASKRDANGEDVVQVAMEGLIAWIGGGKEGNEDVRAVGLRAMVRVSQVGVEGFGKVEELTECFVRCSTFLTQVLAGQKSEADRRALLVALAEPLRGVGLPRWFFGEGVVEGLEKVFAGSGKGMRADYLRTLTVLCGWAKGGGRSGKMWDILGDVDSSPVFILPEAYASFREVGCVLYCAQWMVHNAHPAKDAAIASVFRLCLDNRPDVSSAALKQIVSFRNSANAELCDTLFMVLWQTQFCGAEGARTVAKDYDFDDGMVGAERLGQALLAAVLPDVSIAILPLVALAANHPRLRRHAAQGKALPRSRYWGVIERSLEPVESNAYDDVEDWLGQCLQVVFGSDGLQSDNPVIVSAAVNTLAALGDYRRSYSNRVLRQSLMYLRPLALKAARLDGDAYDALQIVQEAERQATEVQGSGDGQISFVQKKFTKKQAVTCASNPRFNQQKQSEIDRARAAATNANTAAEKANAARALADQALVSIRISRSALTAIRVLCLVTPTNVRNLTAAMLSLILPSAKLEPLEESCREALNALTITCTKRLQYISVGISNLLYALEGNSDVRSSVAMMIQSLKCDIPPALSAEDFALISPILRAALLQDPELEGQGISSGQRGSTKRRDAIAVVKAAAQILLEHCKPEAIDAAVAAAASRAGSWVVQVLEREDGAFAPAADALALLTGTVLTPATDQLSQVLTGVISGKSSVRDATLSALSRLPQLSSAIDCPRDAVLGRALWLVRFDPDESNAELARELWVNYNHPLFVAEDVPEMLTLLAHKESDIREMSARAIAAALRGAENEATRSLCIPQMFTIYLKNLPSAKSKVDSHIKKGVLPAIRRGLGKARSSMDAEGEDGCWFAREGVALAIENLATANALQAKDITVAFAFLSGHGISDSDNRVRAKMSKAAIEVVQTAGTLGPKLLLPIIERGLNTTLNSSASKEDILHADRTRENLVMCLGSVARFLPASDPRVGNVAEQVIRSALETPSEVVQNAAARCLAPLARSAIGPDKQKEVTELLLGTVWSDEAGYGERRGAAYALAGISKGLGLKYIGRFKIMAKIEAALSEKSPRRRQGGFILVETNAVLMGRLFEPYSAAILPFLLSCMGDSVIEVRNACWAAAQAAMSEISSQGVKLILPTLLKGLTDRQWRTKAGSAEVLGAMAFCAPRQLAQCLPQVVPKLADALADAHPRVVSSAESAINRIVAVVRSPEVRKLSPFLLAALRDPAGRTRGAIDAMLGSEFVHAIDAASLALLIPPLHRGLRDRSSELKKRSAAIVGSMCNNVSNYFDVVPYLDLLLPSLRVTLLDAIPDVRRTSARAMGALAVALGEKGLPDVVPWLINALLGRVQDSVIAEPERRKEKSLVRLSSAERSGAAMGLAEVAASMSETRLEDVLDRVLAAGRSSAESREGGLMLISFMPRALGERFEPRVGRALSATLQGLADDADNVREAAFQAGRSLVSAYAKSSLDHLLPEILAAMRDNLWRIRLAATHLLGDLLLVIAGARPDRPEIYDNVHGAGNDEELDESGSDEDKERRESNGDDESEDFDSPEQAAAAMTTESTMNAIEKVLGTVRRNEVLAALYIIKCDVSIRVRQAGLQVWKTVVSNTPRVLREIMPSAVRQIVDGLGDEDEERSTASGRTLGDLSQKLGDRVVPEVLPALRAGITSESSSVRIRKGACEGLGELVLASPKPQLEEHSKDLVDTVYIGLCDKVASVRVAAARVFRSLLRPLGSIPVDYVVPLLMQRLSNENDDDGDSERALDALKEILASSGPRLMAVVVPSLLKENPLSTAAARALAAAATVGEGSFDVHIVRITESVIDSIEAIGESDTIEPLEDIAVALASCGEQSATALLDELFMRFAEGHASRRIAASRVCTALCKKVPSEVSFVAGRLLEVLIRQLADVDAQAAQAAWEALKALADAVPTRALSVYIPIVRQSLRSAASGIAFGDGPAPIQGLQMPKAAAPLVGMLTEGLLFGEAELREQAALGIGELVELTNPKSIGPFVIKLTGSLIRVLSDRFPWQVKAAVLKALLLLLKSSSAMLRTFAPQLQGTFVKSLSDNSGVVRKRACAALGALVPTEMRLERLLNDLVSLGHNGDLPGSRSAAFHSCSQVFRFAKQLPQLSFSSIPVSIIEGLSDKDEEVRNAAGRALGFLAKRSEDCDQFSAIMNLVLERINSEEGTSTEVLSAIMAVGAIFAAGSEIEGLRVAHIEQAALEVEYLVENSEPAIKCAACAAGADLFGLLANGISKQEGCEEQKRSILLKIAERAEFDAIVDVRVAALQALRTVIITDPIPLRVCSRSIVVCASETNTGIRNAANGVLRRAFLSGRDLKILHSNVQIAKEELNAEDQKFIDRRITKLRTLPESEDE